MKPGIIAMILISCLCYSCSDEKEEPALSTLDFSMSFDTSLPRLGNFGEPVSVPTGHAAQHPNMQEVSVHYIELAPDAWTPLGAGAIVYQGEETKEGGSSAVDFDLAKKLVQNEIFHSVNLSALPAGRYEWIRVSLTYQKYDIQYRLNIPPIINDERYTARLASFVGFNTFIRSHTLLDSTLRINANKSQGYWALETNIDVPGYMGNHVYQGDGAGVTVVNPIQSTSPIPAGSCVVTGKLNEPLLITADQIGSKEINLRFSINNSFEWVDIIPDGQFEPGVGETVVDMGLRGLHPVLIQ